MAIKSKALEINLADYHVDVDIDKKFVLLQDIMSVYLGVLDEFNTFLKELSHPYKNREYILKLARRYSLDYFYLLKKHPEGEKGAAIFIEIFLDAFVAEPNRAFKIDAIDNMLLYMERIVKESGADFCRFKPVIDDAFLKLYNLRDEEFYLLVRSYYPITRTAAAVVQTCKATDSGFGAINQLLIKYLKYSYTYWCKKKDPLEWFSGHTGELKDKPGHNDIFDDISHEKLNNLNSNLRLIEKNEVIDSGKTTEKLTEFPGFNAFIKNYHKVPRQLYNAGLEKDMGHRWKLLFLFHIMSINGLASIHEDVLRDINRTMKYIITHEEMSEVRELIAQTFSILKVRASRYPEAALNCVLSMGEGIYKTDDIEFVNYFVDLVIDLGFQAPMIKGVGDDWQIIVNSHHVLNIRIWMKIIELNPKWSSRLLSALVIHLTISGIFIKDTDLFPRDITRFFGKRVGPVYHLCKQLARLFPVYFNEIGAEGALRDISTEIDEVCKRKDVLIHYLRKQSHVESSNRITCLMEGVLEFWGTGNKESVKKWVPEIIYKGISVRGRYFDGVNQVIKNIEKKFRKKMNDLVGMPAEELKIMINHVKAGTSVDRKRVFLAIEFCKLLHQKYNLNSSELETYIAGLESRGFPDIQKLRNILNEPDLKNRLVRLIGYLEQLKKMVLADEEYEVHEDIYQKRHIAVDIPSMYGTYHEVRFNAMGLTFRIEAIVNVLFEEYINTVDLSLITKGTFYQIYNRLMIFDSALKADGINSSELEKQLNLMIFALASNDFSYTQYLDIIKGFVQAVRNIINVYFNNRYRLNLDRILSELPEDRILPKYLSPECEKDREKLKFRISEIFFREKISFSLGLQQLDVFLSRILQTLYNQADILTQKMLQILLNYDPLRIMSSIDKSETLALGIVVLGNKGINLCKLKSFDWPIPTGFIITSEVYRCRSVINNYPEADRNFKTQLSRRITEIEIKTGKKFGDPKNPLLLSVRSGSSISQPGMMDTLLNVGINETISEQIAHATKNPWFAWDNYRRFLQCYGMAHHLLRDDFDLIINTYKNEKGIRFKSELSGIQMKELALKYREYILSSGIEIIEEPFEQLRVCIKNVLDSWELPKAKVYRKIMGISDDWGTAVTIQCMVYGNLSRQSGSGVLFTHNPRLPGDTMKLWGDFTIGNQGEDVAAGLVNTLPISCEQKEFEQHETEICLETHFPDIFEKLRQFAFELTSIKNWNPQEIEFTFESPSEKDLYILQARDMVLDVSMKTFVFDVESIAFHNSYIAHGIGVSGSAMSGRIVFSLEDIEQWKKSEPETPLILIRNDTVPDDIKEINGADGLLTAKGGMTSHASVVAHRLEKTCVVGCSELICDEKKKECEIANLPFKIGDYISINGQEGSVYQGYFETRES